MAYAPSISSAGHTSKAFLAIAMADLHICLRALAASTSLARSARAEAQLPVRCVDGGLAAACECGDALLEPELVVRSAHRLAPRLSAARSCVAGLMRLHFHARGALSNLFIEPQSVSLPVSDTELLVAVRAVGLNFRDVLNVLGEYPGDPGPPGGDLAGTASDAFVDILQKYPIKDMDRTFGSR